MPRQIIIFIDHMAFTLGERVEIPSTGQRGVIRFVGETKFKADGSIWAGIELDDTSGKNDGSVLG